MTERPPSERVRFPEDGIVGRVLRVTRHPIRILAMAAAAAALVAGIATTSGLVSAMLGAGLGVVLGERLGRSRLRLDAALGIALGLLLASVVLSWLFTDFELVPDLVGPASALGLSAIVRYYLVALALVTAFRTASVRHPPALALELAAVVVPLAIQFAAHRDGVIARPLWLSDWAWQRGIDPATVFLFLGGAAAVVLAVLLVLENRGGRTTSTLISLPLLALLAVACLDVVGRPQPEADDGLGLTTEDEGEEPEDHGEGGNGDNSGGDGGGPGPSFGDGGGTGPRGGDGGTPGPMPHHGDGGAGGGQSGRDGGAGGGGAGADAGTGGGGGQTGRDGGGGGGGGRRDGGAGGGGRRDGGAGGGGRDGGAGGGGGRDGGAGGLSTGDGSVGDGGGGGSGRDSGMRPFSWDAGPVGQPQMDQNGGGSEQQQQQQQQQQQNQQQQDQQGPSSSPAPMAIVVLYDDYSPPAQGYYFRQEAWSELEGVRLVASTLPDADRDTLAAFPTDDTSVTPPPSATGRTQVGARVAMLVEHQRPFALESPLSFRPVSNPSPERFVTAYEFRSLAQTDDYQSFLGRHVGDPAWSAELSALYLTPHPDARFAELAEQIIETDLPANARNDPFARAVAIKLWLDKNLTYSTRERHANADDPTVDFLFGNRIGYCVHFAHAAVFLWRTQGIPARVGAGYMVPEENRRGGSSIMVRSSDAHAWPELYIEGYGWLVLDIAAEHNLDQPGQPLDEDLQRMLGEMAREQPAEPEDEIRDEPDEPFDLGIELWALALIVFGAALLTLYLVKLYRRVRPMFARGRVLARVAYRAHLDRLAEVGLSREFGETREQFATRAASVSPSFASMTALHVASQLRDPTAPPKDEHDPGRWRELGRTVRGELRKGTRLWRRLVGLLHPVSFLDAR